MDEMFQAIKDCFEGYKESLTLFSNPSPIIICVSLLIGDYFCIKWNRYKRRRKV